MCPNILRYHGLDGLEEMKIGVIVRTVLRKMLENGEVGQNEIEQMQTKEYSKEIFDIQMSARKMTSLSNGNVN